MRWIAIEKGEGAVITDSTNWGDYSNSPSGTVSKAKEIYGLAGGVWEWTTEKNTSGQAFRGGVKTDTGNSSPAGYRGFKNGTIRDEGTSFRMSLYVTRRYKRCSNNINRG